MKRVPARRRHWFVVFLILAFVPAAVSAQTARPASTTGTDLTSDFRYLVNNTEADAEDIITSPLHIGQAGALLKSPRFYLVLAGAGAAFVGSFALDQTTRAGLRGMSSSDANLLQNLSYGSVSTATALLYGYGVYEHDSPAREYAITAGEGAGLASLFVLAFKASFGRLRPNQDHHDHDAFFHGGKSFVSGDVAPMFALATGVSEYYGNRWYVATPLYSLALLDGFGRIGHDRHWLSDVVGAALIGSATTELLLYLHGQHSEHPGRFRIFPATPPVVTPNSRGDVRAGVTVAFDW
jgi:membrane-associated phospholipid phosphatase